MRTEEIKKIDALKLFIEERLDEMKENILEVQMDYYQTAKTFWSVPLNPFPIPKDGICGDVISSSYSFPGKPSWCELDLGFPEKMPFSIMIVSWDFEGRAPGKIIFGEVDPPGPVDISFSIQSIFSWKDLHWVKEIRYCLHDGIWAETSWISGEI